MTQSLAQNIAANVITAAMTKTEALVIQTAIHAGLNGLAQGAASSAMGGTFADGFEAGVLSGVQSGIYNGIGDAKSLGGPSIGNLGAGITVKRVLAHGLVGGAFARARGDSFGSGFATGVFSKLSAGTLSKNFSDPFTGAAASAIIGGTASTLSGGKFANGALSGAFGYLFNQAAHSYSECQTCDDAPLEDVIFVDLLIPLSKVKFGWRLLDELFATKSAFDVAKQGGKHAGFLKNYLGQSAEKIQKGIASIEKQIATHQDKIANPAKHIKDWHKLDPRQQKALINKKWPSDIQRQIEQRDILRGILKERN